MKYERVGVHTSKCTHKRTKPDWVHTLLELCKRKNKGKCVFRCTESSSVHQRYSPLLRSETDRNNMTSRRGVFRFNRTLTPPSKEENPLSRSTIGLEPTEAAPNFLPFETEPSRRPVTLETQPTPNTTETESSYHTAHHITEPFEHLVDEVLERRNRQNEEIDRTKKSMSKQTQKKKPAYYSEWQDHCHLNQKKKQNPKKNDRTKHLP